MEKNIQKSLLPFRVDDAYIKQPWPMAALKGDLSRSQTNILICIADQLQERIKDYMDNKPQRDSVGQMSLFSPEDFNQGRYQFPIDLSSVCKHACDYADVEKAAISLNRIMVPIVGEKDGEIYKSEAQLMRCWIPTSKNSARRTGKIYADVDESVLTYLTNMSKGFSKHIRSIAEISSCKYTPHLYIYLSKFFNISPNYEWDYNELRETLGLNKKWQADKNDPNNGVWVACQIYKDYRDFSKRVLKKAKEELDELLMQGKVDFSFDFEPKAGSPSKIKFTCILQDHVEVSKTKHTNKYAKPWSKFVKDMGEKDPDFCSMFVSPCEVNEHEGALVIITPSTFVIEKWQNNISAIQETWMKHFKTMFSGMKMRD